MKVNFYSIENQRLEQTSQIQGYLCKFTPGLSKVKRLGIAPVLVGTVLIQDRH